MTSQLGLAAIAASIVLMFGASARGFQSARLGLLTAAFFALTPLLWQQVRQAPASLYALPLLVGALAAIAYGESGRGSWRLPIAGALLGAGVYTSDHAAALMPLYLLLTTAILAYERSIPSRELAKLPMAFALVAAPFAVTLWREPTLFREAMIRYHLYDATRFNILQGAREMTSWVGLTARSEVYYDYFNPAFLFLTDSVLFLPMLVLIPLGVYHVLAYESTAFARLSLGGFLLAPFAAALTAEAPTPGRILFLTPFASIISSYGLLRLLSVVSVAGLTTFAGATVVKKSRAPSHASRD